MGRDGERWFESLVDSELHDLFVHVRLVYPLANAEHVTVEALGRARLDRLAPPSASNRAWLRRLARQVVRRDGDDRVERGRQMDAVEFSMRDVLEKNFDRAVHGVDQVLEVLRGLPLDDQEILRMTCLEDLATAELALILDLSPADVSVRLATAQERLRRDSQFASPDVEGGGANV